ncbi:hypothetical protein BMF94_2450 [Rhodotorula taiwanensis]|uniref:F-box domain-containing protein n=1 Tax=Rhodotorula taiwanensis TaxID=741276 RepID=A0A2S5BCG6_9BASI|nr:hypothetical protein BMF94_2450 [Rhodotorula taiwanensis]
MSARTPANAIALTMLPTELLEQILDEIFLPDAQESTSPQDRTSLLAIMKTCRALYALGSVRHYYSPLVDFRHNDGFHKLARTLRSNSTLAGYVKDLISLSHAVEDDQRARYGGDEQQPEQQWHESLDLQLDVLEACTNVKDLSVILSTRAETGKIASLLASNTDLRYLVLSFDFPPSVSYTEPKGRRIKTPESASSD